MTPDIQPLILDSLASKMLVWETKNLFQGYTLSFNNQVVATLSDGLMGDPIVLKTFNKEWRFNFPKSAFFFWRSKEDRGLRLIAKGDTAAQATAAGINPGRWSFLRFQHWAVVTQTGNSYTLKFPNEGSGTVETSNGGSLFVLSKIYGSGQMVISSVPHPEDILPLILMTWFLFLHHNEGDRGG